MSYMKTNSYKLCHGEQLYRETTPAATSSTVRPFLAGERQAVLGTVALPACGDCE